MPTTNDAAAAAATRTEPAASPPPQSSQHGEPYDGMMCLATMEDITTEGGNYVEYQSYPSMEWRGALYEKSVVEQLLKDQFHQFVERVKTTDCQAELRRLLAKGPPVYVEDQHAMPLARAETDTHICKLWFASDPDVERSSKLDGAVEGEERQKLWDELKQFIIVEGKEEGDDDGDDNGNNNDANGAGKE